MHSNNNIRTVIITGANKGIGYATVEKLLQESNPYDIILTARNPKLGEEAFETLSNKYPSSSSKLTFQQLNLSDPKSIESFIDWLKRERNGKFDTLLNNAGYGFDKDGIEDRLDTININFVQTVDLTEKLLPYLADDGKIIMVSSTLGILSGQGSKMQKVLSDLNLSKEETVRLTNQLIEKTKDLSHTELGWSESTYDATKALLNAYTRWVLVKLLKQDQQCYVLCPGWCRTDMGGANAALPVEAGAETPVYLINLAHKFDEKINGKFFENSKVREF